MSTVLKTIRRPLPLFKKQVLNQIKPVPRLCKNNRGFFLLFFNLNDHYLYPMQELAIRDDQHSVQLDGLRFFAVFAVMFAHWLQWDLPNQPWVMKLPFVHGVLLFFVLSGFLITRIILKNKAANAGVPGFRGRFLKNFYIRRALRIFPIYYGLLILLLVINFDKIAEYAPWLFTYTINIYQAIKCDYLGPFNHLWSLSVEEQFYLLWPLLLLLIPARRVLLFIVLVIAISIGTKAGIFLFTDNWIAGGIFTISSMHALAIGALLAWLMSVSHPLLKKLDNPAWLYGTAVVYVLAILFLRDKIDWYKEIFDDMLFAILSVLVIYRASAGRFRFGVKWVLENPVVAYGGKISYGMYLYHLFIPSLFYYYAPKIGLGISNKYTFFVALCCITYVLAHFSWVLIEKPLNSLKKYFPYSKQTDKNTAT